MFMYTDLLRSLKRVAIAVEQAYCRSWQATPFNLKTDRSNMPGAHNEHLGEAQEWFPGVRYVKGLTTSWELESCPLSGIEDT